MAAIFIQTFFTWSDITTKNISGHKCDMDTDGLKLL